MVSCREAPDSSPNLDQIAGRPTTLPTLTITPSVTPSATVTPSPTLTPSPTNTPSPTPTPTPTALPVAVSGDPRLAGYSPPVPSGNAPCGVVDTLDYPLEPPDAVGTRGGSDFGVYRSRYEKYHAGEDWGITRGEGNFGRPVYSIGHGLITYAEPLGWGRDQGVVIVQHTFADGHTFLSFYGHLDPPSVLRSVGTCVARGDLVGEIGRPRSSPHLHFEIRTHLPYQPGPGYWETDPTEAGWLPPSQTIWNARIEAAAGVRWRDTVGEGTARPVGFLTNDDLLILVDQKLHQVNLQDGNRRPVETNSASIGDAVMDSTGQAIYVADRLGVMAKYRPVEGELDVPFELHWEADFDMVGTPTLMPMPAGGVAYFARNELITLSAAGEITGRHAISGRVASWVVSENLLVFNTAGRADQLWVVAADGQIGGPIAISGETFLLGRQIGVYAADGIYQILEGDTTPILLYRLPTAFLEYGDILPLADGRILLAHRDLFDRRLILLAADGRLLWERSLSNLDEGEMRLVELDAQVYLINGLGGASERTLSVYAVNLEQPGLLQVLDQPIRPPVGLTGWAYPLPSRQLLLGIDENLVLFDLLEAQTITLSTE